MTQDQWIQMATTIGTVLLGAGGVTWFLSVRIERLAAIAKQVGLMSMKLDDLCSRMAAAEARIEAMGMTLGSLLRGVSQT